MVFTMLRLRKAVTPLTQEQFIEGYRKAQLIDVREQKDFEAGHILGARNIPFSQLRQRYKEVRPDLPIYLYDQTCVKGVLAALFLNTKDYKHLDHLHGGLCQRTRRIKSK